MSAKKSTKPTIPDSIVLNEDQKKLPEVKALLKRLKSDEEKHGIEKKLSPVIELSNKTLGKNFQKFAQLAKYVARLTGSVAPVKRLDDKQKQEIVKLKNANRTPAEIAKALNLKYPQVYTFLNPPKKKGT